MSDSVTRWLDAVEERTAPVIDGMTDTTDIPKLLRIARAALAVNEARCCCEGHNWWGLQDALEDALTEAAEGSDV